MKRIILSLIMVIGILSADAKTFGIAAYQNGEVSDNGDYPACGQLGMLTAAGDGVEKDIPFAKKLLSHGCNADDADSCLVIVINKKSMLVIL